MRDFDTYAPLLRLAYQHAWRCSDDGRSKNGAVLLDENLRAIGTGTNRFPAGVLATEARQQVPDKYEYILHAELDALLSAGRLGYRTSGATLVCPWASCRRCAGQIIQAQVATLVRHRDMMARTPDRWAEEIMRADVMFREAGVKVVEVTGRLGGCKSMLDGKEWYP